MEIERLETRQLMSVYTAAENAVPYATTFLSHVQTVDDGGSSVTPAYSMDYTGGDTPSTCACHVDSATPATGTVSQEVQPIVITLGDVSLDGGSVITTVAATGQGPTVNRGGNNTLSAGLARIVSTDGTDSSASDMYVINGSTSVEHFKSNGDGTYTPPYGTNETLQYLPGESEYRLTKADGTTWVFNDIDADDSGEPIEMVSPGGVVTNFTYNTDTSSATYGALLQVESSITIDSVQTSERLAYSYLASGANAGKISEVELDQQSGSAGPWVPVQAVLYTYYTTTAGRTWGSTGDLETATLIDGGPGMEPSTTAASGTRPMDTTYYYEVTAVTGGGEGNPSAELAASTGMGGGNITLNWTPVANATAYNVYRGTSSGGEQFLATVTGVTTFTDSLTSTGTSVPPLVPVGTSYFRYQTITLDTGANISSGVTTPVPTNQDVLEYAYGPASLARLLSSSSGISLSSLLTTNASSWNSAGYNLYADVHDVSYDSYGRILTRVVQGEGCSSCGSGLGTFTYNYSSNALDPGIGYNSWNTETTVTNPDSSAEYIYYDGYNEPMLDIVQDVGQTAAGATSRYEATFTVYDSEGMATLVASPSAVILPSPAGGSDPWSTLDAHNDLLNFNSTSGTYEYLAQHAGLITTTAYESIYGVGGEVEASTSVQEGEQGYSVLQENMSYGSLSVTYSDSYTVTIPVLSTDATYANADGTGSRVTTYSYSYYSDTFQPYEMVETAPSIGSTENGTGATQATTTYYNPAGDVIWTVDPAGFINYNAYDPATNAVIQTVQDTSWTLLNVSSSPPPSTYDGFTLPRVNRSGSPTPLNLSSTMTVDNQGRTTETVTPAGRTTYVVYNDTYAGSSTSGLQGIRNEVRVYSGWTSSGPTGPIQVTRDVWPAPGSVGTTYSESFTTTDAASISSSGTPLGNETITIPNVASLQRSIDNSAGQVVESDSWYSLAGITGTLTFFSSLGTSGVNSSSGNYYKTTYGYDANGVQNRVLDPNGTIYRTVTDTVGNVLSKWVGTNDTVASGEYWSPSNNSSGTSNMTDVEDDAYDQSFAPASPSLSTATLSGAVPEVYNVETTYVYQQSGSSLYGETVASQPQSMTVSATNVGLVVNSPATMNLPSGVALYYNVYIANASGTEELQNTSGPIPIGTNYVLTSSTLVTSMILPQLNGSGANNLTSTIEHPGGGSGTDRETDYLYNWQNEQVAEKGGVGSSLSAETSTSTGVSEVFRPLAYMAMDNAGETLASYQYDGDGVPLSDFAGLAVLPEPTNSAVIPAGLDVNRLQAMSSSDYDDQGRVYRSTVYWVANAGLDLSTLPTIDSSTGLTTNYFFDVRGDLIETVNPGGLVTKSQFNGVGWDVLDSTSDGGALNNASSPHAFMNPYYAGVDTYDIVLSQTATQYDADGNPILVTGLERYHNDSTGSTGEGDLGGPQASSLNLSSVNYYTADYYDNAGRMTYSVDIGTNGGLAYTYVASGTYGYVASFSGTTTTAGTSTSLVASGTFMNAPSGSFVGDMISLYSSPTAAEETIITGYNASSHTFTFSGGLSAATSGETFYVINPNLVTETQYGSDGRVADTVDPRGLKTGYSYNLDDQQTQVIADDNGGSETSSTNVATDYVYDGNGDVVLMTAVMPSGTANQSTAYIYGVTNSASGLFSNDLISTVEYPNSSTGVASSSSSDDVSYTYDALGEISTSTDQNGTQHTFNYDVLGREISDIVTNLPSTVDGSVMALGYSFDQAGRPLFQTSYSDTSMSTVVNQVEEAYNGYGQTTDQWQEYSGGVDVLYSNKVVYNYSNNSGGAPNSSLLVNEIYPNGRVINYNYATGLDLTIGRIDGISDASGSGSGSLVAYTFMGLDTVVDETDGNGVSLDYIAGSATSTATSPGNIYGGLDRFGRVVNQDWTNGGFAVADLIYGYDADGNVMTRTDATSTASANNSESYTYDGLNRLTGWALGNIGSGSITSPVNSQEWSLDALGNWAGETTGGTTVSRINNAKNEIASQGGSTMSYNSVGDLTQDSSGYGYVYDAWNRLVKVIIPGGSSTNPTNYASYTYMAGTQMAVTENFSGSGTTESYYDMAGRRVETDQETISYGCGGSTTTYTALSQYVWGLTYVNDLVERDTNTYGAGTANYGTTTSGLNQRLYAVRDANHDVIAITDTSGAVVQRMDYTPYGTMTVMNASYGSVSDGYAWNVGFQGGIYLEQSDGSPGGSTANPLIQFDNRVYDTALGRWLQPDPAGYVDGVNGYQLENSEPAVGVDPSGLMDIGGHFWITWMMLHSMGYQNAYELAYYTQYPDQDPDFDAYKQGWIATRHLGIGDTSAWARDVQDVLHSLIGGTHQDLMNRRQCLASLLRTQGLKTWVQGLLLHAIGDTFAHADQKGNPYRYPHGHAFDGKTPDALTGYNMQSIFGYIDFLSAFYQPQAPNQTWGLTTAAGLKWEIGNLKVAYDAKDPWSSDRITWENSAMQSIAKKIGYANQYIPGAYNLDTAPNAPPRLTHQQVANFIAWVKNHCVCRGAVGNGTMPPPQ